MGGEQALKEINELSKNEMIDFLNNLTEQEKTELMQKSSDTRDIYYGKSVYTRGLIEFTNYCKNNCLYCGIRRDNKNIERYRLTKEQILHCCAVGYELGYHTFVLQGGEDPYYTDDIMTDIISSIKQQYPDCALTLSIGEKSYDSYKRFYDAGADRYLLRHETANEEHYNKLHPSDLSLKNRKECLFNLKKIGYQVGAGFMVGSPFQTTETIADDLFFLKELQPEMVGIGPFIPQKDTPFGEKRSGKVEQTITLIAITRLLLPTALIPATTAVGTLDPIGREKAIRAGANVVMPNLSPLNVRKKYLLYDNKICTGEEAAECKNCLEKRIENAGFVMDYSKGDHINTKLR
jgi:biotin synthase